MCVEPCIDIFYWLAFSNGYAWYKVWAICQPTLIQLKLTIVVISVFVYVECTACHLKIRIILSHNMSYREGTIVPRKLAKIDYSKMKMDDYKYQSLLIMTSFMLLIYLNRYIYQFVLFKSS